MPRSMTRITLPYALLCIILFACALAVLPRAHAAFAPDPVAAAWQRVQERGAYSFDSDVVQTTTPSASVANIGLSSREQRLHLAGQNDLRSNSPRCGSGLPVGACCRPKAASRRGW